MTDDLNEGPFDGLSRMTKNFAMRGLNAVGAAMGNGEAKANLKMDDARKDMWNRWNSYSRLRGMPDARNSMPWSLACFFYETYGQKALQLFTNSLALAPTQPRDPKDQSEIDAALAQIKAKFKVSPQGASQQGTQPSAGSQQAAAPAAQQARQYGDQRDVGQDARARGNASADTKAAIGDVMRMFGGGVSKNPYDQYQVKTMAKVLSATRQPQLDRASQGAVFNLAKELIASANERGEGEKKRVLTFLRRLEKEPELSQKMPNLVRFIQSAGKQLGIKEGHEPLMLAIGLARILVEHEVRTPAALHEALNIAVADRFAVLEAAYDRAYLDTLFVQMTQNLFRMGVLQHPDDVASQPKGNAFDTSTDQGGQQNPQSQQSGGFSKASEVRAMLNSKVQNLKPETLDAIVRAVQTSKTIDEVEKVLDQKGVTVSPRVWTLVQKAFK